LVRIRASFISVLVFAAVAACAGIVYGQDKPSSGELVNHAWAVHGQNNVEETFKVTQQVIDLYKEEADKQQAGLSVLPKNKDEIAAVQSLNDVGVAYFIQAESLMRQQKNDEAKKIFQLIVEKYPYAQAWDQRGWFWRIGEAAQKSIDKLEGKSIAEDVPVKKQVSQRVTKINLYDPGKEDFIDYSKYGEIVGAGTENYKYLVKDQEGLSLAVGEAIYPNTTSVRWDPAFKAAMKEKRLEGDQWDFLQSPDLEAAFFKWALASEPQGVKLYYTGLILEKAGLITHAIKCYYAIVVHYPGSYGWTYWHTPWYVGQSALAKIHFLLRRNPKLGYKLVDADIKIINGYDKDVANDRVIANPGRFVKANNLLDKLKAKPDLDLLSIKKRSGKGKVYVVQYETGDWQLMVDGKPYMIQAVTYAPTKVGQSPDNGTLENWMNADENKNGKADGPYDAFVDKNRNGKQDANEPVVGDFQLMKDMGVNTLRLYHHPLKPNKDLLREMYQSYGIRVIMGDFLGKYALGSGAQWNPGTDYENEEHKKNMTESVLAMVREYKDEPFVLFWLLGNENVYGYACNADQKPEAFFSFASEVAKKIKEIDPDHPVAVCSGDILFLDRFGKYAKDVDIFGTNAYRGNSGFGLMWRQVKEESDKPAFITEYGCSAIYTGKSAEEGEDYQADYHFGSWEDIYLNRGFGEGSGNSIGGVAFEWVDEWWKGYEPSVHDEKGTWPGPFPDGTMHEEWLGLCGQGDGKLSPFLRELRKAYFTYKKLWK